MDDYVKNRVVLGYFCECPNCKRKMERRKHKIVPYQCLRRKAGYYSEWDVCKLCGTIKNYGIFLVIGGIDQVEELGWKP
jgi:hypothetical protein